MYTVYRLNLVINLSQDADCIELRHSLNSIQMQWFSLYKGFCSSSNNVYMVCIYQVHMRNEVMQTGHIISVVECFVLDVVSCNRLLYIK